jgi:hypothetical protein
MVGRVGNQATSTNDPIAYAEVMAINHHSNPVNDFSWSVKDYPRPH